MNKINVLHLINSMDPGGAENLLKFQYPYFNNKNFKIHIGFLIGNGSLLKGEPLILKKNFSYKGKFNPLCIFKIIDYIKKNKITVLHSHLIHSGIISKLILFLTSNLKIISTRHYAKESKDVRLINKIDFFLLKYDTKIICISNYVKNHLLNKGISKDKLKVIYNGIDSKFYDKFNKPNKNNLIIGTIGRLSEQKGIDITLKAFKSVLKDFPDLKLEIIGDGPLKNAYKNISKELGIQNSVSFLGYLQPLDLIKYMEKWKIFVLPSRWEGFGMVLVEAGAMQLPSITTNVEAIPEIIKDGINGYLVNPNDFKSISNYLLLLLKSNNKCIQMGKNARDIAIKKFSLKKMVKDIEKLYEAI